MITRSVAIRNLNRFIGQDLFALAEEYKINPFKNGKQDKGWKGQVLTKCAGLKRDNLQAPNGLGFELKSVAFIESNGLLKPKETMAITMINPDDLEKKDFFDSHCWEKLKSLVLCAVSWTEPNQKSGAEFLKVTSFDFQNDENLIEEIKADYDLIRSRLVNCGFGALTGKDGKWIQARTKGPGGINPNTGEPRPKTRAFYARKELVEHMFNSSVL